MDRGIDGTIFGKDDADYDDDELDTVDIHANA